MVVFHFIILHYFFSALEMKGQAHCIVGNIILQHALPHTTYLRKCILCTQRIIVMCILHAMHNAKTGLYHNMAFCPFSHTTFLSSSFCECRFLL